MNFNEVREMRPYLAEPKAMPTGVCGKVGFLHLGFTLDDDGRSIMSEWERRAPLIVQQELYFDEEMPQMPCVYILSSGGPNVDGDRYEQHFVMHRGSFAHISTGAATKIAQMRYNFSGLTQRFTLDEGAYLEYMPEPVIPCRHSRFIADTVIRIAPSATLLYSEIYLSGRKYFGDGERFLYDVLSVSTRAERPDGKPLFREKFVVRPAAVSPDTPGVMNGYDIFANVVVLTPPDIADKVYGQTPAFIDAERRMAAGITHLPSGCGVIYKILGDESETVKREVRRFCSTVRLAVKGRPLFEEFPWR